MAGSESIRLIQKMTRANLLLDQQGLLAIKPHSTSCAIENDPESMAPCSCGATQYNARIEQIRQELDPQK